MGCNVTAINGNTDPTNWVVNLHSYMNITVTYSNNYSTIETFLSRTGNRNSNIRDYSLGIKENPTAGNSTLLLQSATYDSIDLDRGLWVTFTQGEPWYYISINCRGPSGGGTPRIDDWNEGIPFQINHNHPNQLNISTRISTYQEGQIMKFDYSYDINYRPLQDMPAIRPYVHTSRGTESTYFTDSQFNGIKGSGTMYFQSIYGFPGGLSSSQEYTYDFLAQYGPNKTQAFNITFPINIMFKTIDRVGLPQTSCIYDQDDCMVTWESFSTHENVSVDLYVVPSHYGNPQATYGGNGKVMFQDQSTSGSDTR